MTLQTACCIAFTMNTKPNRLIWTKLCYIGLVGGIPPAGPAPAGGGGGVGANMFVYTGNKDS